METRKSPRLVAKAGEAAEAAPLKRAASPEASSQAKPRKRKASAAAVMPKAARATATKPPVVKPEPSKPKARTQASAAAQPSQPYRKASPPAAPPVRPAPPGRPAPPPAAPPVRPAQPPAAPPPAAPAPSSVLPDGVLLGYVISSCVGIQHYRNNGRRSQHEMLHLRREPHNPYDRNAVGVYTIGAPSAQVGHIPAVHAKLVAPACDQLRLKLVGQVNSRGDETYTFPLRVSFFGQEGQQAKLAAFLRGAGLYLVQPAPPRMSKKQRKAERARQRLPAAQPPAAAGAAAGSSGAAASGHAAESDDEVVYTQTVTWAERDAALRAQAIVLE
ncbi:hypothetical protein KFE25_013810 [Diacronema lutheri]|uniref:HIRAN domain-containing protein n=1 Tax=Diacronema lutheri TaxID=2081491 RepID=A0A8J6CBH2_DIALT|nr:hypothetical protein KFE25_013810 [Diacronema lutheri]